MKFTLVSLEEKHYGGVREKFTSSVDVTFSGAKGTVALDENESIIGAMILLDNHNFAGVEILEEYRQQGLMTKLINNFDEISTLEIIYDVTPYFKRGLEGLILRELKHSYKTKLKLPWMVEAYGEAIGHRILYQKKFMND